MVFKQEFAAQCRHLNVGFCLNRLHSVVINITQHLLIHTRCYNLHFNFIFSNFKVLYTVSEWLQFYSWMYNFIQHWRANNTVKTVSHTAGLQSVSAVQVHWPCSILKSVLTIYYIEAPQGQGQDAVQEAVWPCDGGRRWLTYSHAQWGGFQTWSDLRGQGQCILITNLIASVGKKQFL